MGPKVRCVNEVRVTIKTKEGGTGGGNDTEFKMTEP